MSTRVVLRKQASFHGADAKRRTRRKRSRREEDSRRNPWAWGASPAHSPSSTRQRRLLPAPAERARKATRQKQETNDAAASRTLSKKRFQRKTAAFPSESSPQTDSAVRSSLAGGGNVGSRGPGEDPLPTSPPALTRLRSRRHTTSEEVAGNRPPRPRRYAIPLLSIRSGMADVGSLSESIRKRPRRQYPRGCRSPATITASGSRIRSGTPFHVGAAPPLAGYKMKLLNHTFCEQGIPLPCHILTRHDAMEGPAKSGWSLPAGVAAISWHCRLPGPVSAGALCQEAAVPRPPLLAHESPIQVQKRQKNTRIQKIRSQKSGYGKSI